tara:strand:- start:129 stop:281 length:153 start_codon:yes stop_codon:yes gene_type:complete
MVWHPIISHLDFQLFSSNRNPEKRGKEKVLDIPLRVTQQPILSLSLTIQG